MVSSFVITGYLGSGKTTLILNSVREHLKHKNIAVIVNEFGEVGLDGRILKNVYSQVLEIEEGCICCKLSQEFEKAVMEIISLYSPEVIIVESSGTSEPFPIVFSLRTVGTAVEGVVCVVDSKNFFRYEKEDTARYQIASANMIVLNKTDLVDEEHLGRVEERVRNIKDTYRIENMFSEEKRRNLYRIYRASGGRVPLEVFEGTGDPLTLLQRHPDHSHGEMGQKVLEIKEDITYKEFKTFMESLPENIYRAKGIVKLKDFPEPLFVHYVFGDLDIGMPAGNYEGKPFLVLIGKSSPKDPP